MELTINKESLLLDASPLLVATALGMKMKKNGTRVSILCPDHLTMTGHMDRHIGNCVLTKNGYKCYSCGASGDVIDLVQNYYKNILGQDISFQDTLEIIADICGGRELYLETSSNQRRDSSFDFKELEVIGLVLKPGSPSLYQLYKEDREAFIFLITGKAKERLDLLNNLIKLFEASPLIDSKMIGFEFRKMQTEIEKILKKYSAEDQPLIKKIKITPEGGIF